MYLKHGLAGLVKVPEAASGGSPSATLAHSSESTGFTSSHDFTTGALSAGDYVAFAFIEQGSITINSATLEGSAMTGFTSGTVSFNSIQGRAFYLTSLAGGGSETLNITLSGSSANVVVILLKVVGTIDTTAVTDTNQATPPDVDCTFVNSADELMLVGWASNAAFSSYDSLTALQSDTAGVEVNYGVGEGNASSGSPDTVGVNFAATFTSSVAIGVRVT